MNADIHIITTKRLRGEALNESHWPIWKAMGANPILMETLGGAWHEIKAREKFLFNLAHWDTNGFGQWMFFSKENNDFIGRCGLRYMEIDDKLVVELGYSVLPQHWRKGYATEMGARALEIGINILNLESVVAFTQISNIASQKTMWKLGFQFEKQIMHAMMEHVLYRTKNEKL